MQTLEDVEAIPKTMLTANDVQSYLDIDPNVFRMQARKDKKDHTDSFGFPVVLVGNRVKIPKDAFISYMRGKSSITQAEFNRLFENFLARGERNERRE